MSLRQSVSVALGPMAALAAVGLFWGGFSALVPDIKNSIGASDAGLGLAMIASAIGGMGSMYLSPYVATLFGRNVLPVFGVVLAAAFFYPLFAWDVASMGVAFFGIGISVAMLDISANIRLGILEARHKLHLMNVSHAMFSFAYGGAALVTGLARKAGFETGQILPALAVLCLVLTGIMWRHRGAVTEAVDSEVEADGTPMPWLAVGLTSVILFASFIGENSTEAWSALHIERTLGGAAGEGGYGPFMLGMAMGFGRLTGQFFSERLGEVRVILGSAVLGVIGAMLIATAQTQGMVVFGVGVLGLGMAVVVPSANSVLGKRVPERLIGLAISRAWLFGFLGFFIGPTMMGVVSEFVGLRWAFACAGAVIALIIPSVWRLGRMPSRQ